MAEVAEIEINLGKLADEEYSVEGGCRLPGIEKKEHGRAQFAFKRLRRLQGANDLAGYGKLLTDELLEDPKIKRFFNETLAAARSANFVRFALGHVLGAQFSY